MQRHATKFILNDYTSDYKTRLIQLGLLSLVYIYEIADILFFIKSLKTPTDKFNMLTYVNFNTDSTRSSGTKLHHKTAPRQYSHELLLCSPTQTVELTSNNWSLYNH